MSNVAFIRSAPEEAPAQRDYLGPAEVTGVAEGGAVSVRLDDGRAVEVRLATVAPYDPRPGDEVLVIGDGRGHYVIGVLRSSGKAVLEVKGDLEIRAVGGELRLSGEEGVRVEGKELSVEVGRARVLAGAVVSRVASMVQRVAEMLDVQAGEQRTLVRGASFAQSKSATILTEEKVTINGRAIHLG